MLALRAIEGEDGTAAGDAGPGDEVALPRRKTFWVWVGARDGADNTLALLPLPTAGDAPLAGLPVLLRRTAFDGEGVVLRLISEATGNEKFDTLIGCQKLNLREIYSHLKTN